MKVKKYVRWLPAVLWMAVIFYLSAQPAGASSELSRGVMHVIVQGVGDMLPIETGVLHQIIRKGAHLTAYFILAILLMIALARKKRHSAHHIGIVLVLCIIYAISDELHQLFVPGRSGEVRDVVIDTIGSLLGSVCYITIRKGCQMYRE